MAAPDKHIEFIARGLIVEAGAVLLCRMVGGEGYSYLPGGHVEFGETAHEALWRELKEEAGLTPPPALAPTPPLRISEHGFTDGKGRRRHEVYIVFPVERVLGPDGHPITRDAAPPSLEDKIDFHWADLASIVNIDLRPIEIRAWLASDDAGESARSGGAIGWRSSID